MSGHSKWATTKRAKGVADAKRANLFTKLAKNITLAAKEAGGDPVMNFKLRLAIDRAKEGNMPKENIDRAIKRGTGEANGIILEEITYEGYGPAGSAFIIEVVTDNKNRAASEIKHIFTDIGGTLGGSNSVSWMFDRVGGIKAELGSLDKESAELEIIDAGADDLEWLDEKTAWIYTKPNDLQIIKDDLEKRGFKITDSEFGYKAKETLEPADAQARNKLEGFYEALDETEDVQNFWSNMDI